MTKFFKCACEHCGGRIEYPAQSVGLQAQCPHCRKQTDLTLPPPPDSGGRAGPSMVWLIIGLAVLVLGGLGIAVAFIMLNRFARQRGR